MRLILLISVIFNFCGLFAQPKPFDPDYYRDTLRVKKSEEFKKLKEFREKYNKLGYPQSLSELHAKEYPTYLADLFYYRGINLDKIDEYEKIIPASYYDLPIHIFNELLRPIVVVGKLLSFDTGSYDDQVTFEIINIIRGREYYNEFPNVIKCYSSTQGEYVDVEYSEFRKERKITTYKEYFGQYDPKIGDEFIVFLDKFSVEDAFSVNEKVKDEFFRDDVFYNIEAKYYDKSNIESRKNIEDIIYKISKLDELTKRK